VALDQRGGVLRHADERPDDLQCPSAPLLGPVRRQSRSRLGGDRQRGPTRYLRIGELAIDTTGVLGLWADQNGLHAHAFPSWATIPSSYNLALARHWHLTFAWLFAGGIVLYGIWSLVNGHLKRDLAPRPAELKPATSSRTSRRTPP